MPTYYFDIFEIGPSHREEGKNTDQSITRLTGSSFVRFDGGSGFPGMYLEVIGRYNHRDRICADGPICEGSFELLLILHIKIHMRVMRLRPPLVKTYFSSTA